MMITFATFFLISIIDNDLITEREERLFGDLAMFETIMWVVSILWIF